MSIVRKDLIPSMQDKPDYLTKNHIRIFDTEAQRAAAVADQLVLGRRGPLHVSSEDPGDHNSLGRIRINFPSQYGVYMHDTPLKNLFGEDFRYDSSGCMPRAECPGSWWPGCSKSTKGWISDKIDAGNQVGRCRSTSSLTKPVPLHWVYVTGWSASDGVVQFREDIYTRDGLGAPAIPATTKL